MNSVHGDGDGTGIPLIAVSAANVQFVAEDG